MNPPAAARLRVLVVDDCADTCAMMKLLLCHWGHNVQTCRDGASAVELCRAFRPGVLFLDIGMPKMDGYEVARRIRQLSADYQPVMVCVSGYSTESHRRRALEAGFEHFWIKPVNPDTIYDLLTEVANNKAAAT